MSFKKMLFQSASLGTSGRVIDFWRWQDKVKGEGEVKL